MGDDKGLKVRIRNAEGKFLILGYREVWFTGDPKRAQVFDYYRQDIAQQLEDLRESIGIVLEAEPISPNDIYETCDWCKHSAMPQHLFFDGQKYLCHECKAAHPDTRAAST